MPGLGSDSYDGYPNLLLFKDTAVVEQEVEDEAVDLEHSITHKCYSKICCVSL